MPIVDDYETNENENNLTPPRGAPENMPPSQVNNTMRRMMAAIREVYDYAAGAISNLGTMANQNADNVNIGGGRVAGLEVLHVPGAIQANRDRPIVLGAPLGVQYGGTGVQTLGQLFAAMGLQGHARLSDYALARMVIPYGAIIPFTGGEGSLGPYFALCDGRTVTGPTGSVTTTPDLRGRFIIGAHPNTPAHSVGGPDPGSGGLFSVETSRAGDHNHGGTQGAALTIGQMPRHDHASVFLPGGENLLGNRNSNGNSNNYIAVNGDRNSPIMVTGQAGNGEPHAHGLNTDGGHTHVLTFSMRPPFYALAYAMAI